ncbi:flagellar basal body P-ring formation chaperone FlgA [Vibrio viridaestus]|uniref:Flagella basal body P-ring formation protein FlgA n=1 Tax=Vibrio viridaestus TaxID=2487322 RepID=A0A3N9TIF1_9VIBR|nr:flagellar basal body P-ring formation chaperone FlgA [Vibrio viridaestus]RQW63989.1 flagella basal body P-ring formation protein FlgA [Vibrio viridaestus]
MFSKQSLTSFSITKCRAFCKLLYSFIALLLFFFSLNAQSATDQQLEQIQKLAESYVVENFTPPSGGTISANAATLDNRLQVSDCPTGLSAFSSSKNGSASNVTVLIECKSENWKVYVPVRLKVTVPAVVATLPLSRGQIITQQDVSLSMVDLLRFRQQGFSSIQQVVGSKTKRNIAVADIIDGNDICVVCRNESVTIKAIKNGLAITTQGTALTDGSWGEQIRVKNDKSNRIIDARVSGISEVTVRF